MLAYLPPLGSFDISFLICLIHNEHDDSSFLTQYFNYIKIALIQNLLKDKWEGILTAFFEIRRLGNTTQKLTLLFKFSILETQNVDKN